MVKTFRTVSVNTELSMFKKCTIYSSAVNVQAAVTNTQQQDGVVTCGCRILYLNNYSAYTALQVSVNEIKWPIDDLMT